MAETAAHKGATSTLPPPPPPHLSQLLLGAAFGEAQERLFGQLVQVRASEAVQLERERAVRAVEQVQAEQELLVGGQRCQNASVPKQAQEWLTSGLLGILPSSMVEVEAQLEEREWARCLGTDLGDGV